MCNLRISKSERTLIDTISAKIDAFGSDFEGKPVATLDSRRCKIQWKEIQSLVGSQTHAWKLVMVVLIDPLDIKIHVRKYVAGQTNNNVIEIALKCDFGDLDDSDRFREVGSPGDGFDSDLDQQGLTTIMTAHDQVQPPTPEPIPLHQSTVVTESVIEVATSEPNALVVPVDSDTATSRSTRTKNPRKKIKLEVDREVAQALAQSLNSFASLLNIRDDSSDDSFEVLPDS